MSAKRHLSKLIAKTRRDEDIGIRDEDDKDAFVGLESILDAWDHGDPPSGDDFEVLVEAARYAVLQRKPGRLRTSKERKQHAEDIKAEANELYRQRRKKCHAVEDAAASWQHVVKEMERLHPGDEALKVKPKRQRKAWEVLRDRWYGR